MRVICQGRRTGRTTQLIEMCAEAEARGECSYIVCHSHEEAYRIKERADEMGKFIGFPITYAEFYERRFSRHNIKNFYIDNVDMFLQYLAAPVRIQAIVIEKDEIEDE